MHRTDAAGKITTYGESKKQTLKIHSPHQVSTSTPSHAFIGYHAKLSQFLSLFYSPLIYHRDFFAWNLPLLQSGRFKSHVVALKKPEFNVETSRVRVAQLVRARDCQSIGRRFDSV